MKPLGSHPKPTLTKVETLTSTASTPKDEIAERNLATAPATTTEKKDAYNSVDDRLALPIVQTPDPTLLEKVKEVVKPTTTKLLAEETKEEDIGVHMMEESTHMTGESPDQIKVGDLEQHATLPGPSTSIEQGMKPLGSHPTPTSTKEEALTLTASAPKAEVATAPATTTEEVKEVVVGTTTQVPAAALTPNEPKDNTTTVTIRPESVDTAECEDSTQAGYESSSEAKIDATQDAALLLQALKAGELPDCKDAMKESKKLKPRKRKSKGIKGVIQAPSEKPKTAKTRSGSGTNTPHEPKDDKTTATMPPESGIWDNNGDRPRGLYTAANKHLRKRVFRCPCCSDAADGSHQCGGCFQHVHVFCGSQYKDSPEGFGQILFCRQCVDTVECKNSTQAGYDRNSHAKIDVTQEAALVLQASEAGGQRDGKDAMKERKRLELANYFRQSTTVKDGEDVKKRKRKRNGLKGMIQPHTEKQKAAIPRSESGTDTADETADDIEAVVPVPPETELTASETFAAYNTCKVVPQ
jgi:hypothetical protein